MAERRPVTRRRTTTAAPKGRSRARADDRLFGMAKVVPLDRVEFAPFCDGLAVGATSPLSPLTGLVAAGGPGAARPFEDLRAPLGVVADETFRWAMEPLAAPDRILDARVAAYEGAPTPTRLYSSRRHGSDWAGLRPAIVRDYELLGPYSEADLGLWIELQLQLTGGNIIPTPWQLMTGEELTFFFGLVDAFKLALHQSFATRRPRPQPLVFRFSDLLNAQNLALKSFDRRWLLTAMGEIFGVLSHPGGGPTIGLPILSATIAEREVRRYVKNGWLAVRDRGKDPLLELDGPLPFLASTLLSWLNIVTLHDIQVTGWADGRATAGEEVMVFIVTEAALWGVVSSGLSGAANDLGGVEFGVQTLTVPEALELGRRFLQPLPIDRLPDDVYAAATVPPPPPRAQPQPAPAAPAAPATPAPWAATHLVPAGGLPAWERPDPTLTPVATLDPGLDVAIAERTVSGWAHIVCSNGWSAWVDAARLEEVGS